MANYFGMGAHNFIVAHFVESGLIGFLTFYTSKNKALPFLLAGMSLAGHAIPYLYAVFVLIILLEKNKGKYIEISIIPVYNVENFVKEAIQSIQNQTYKNIEIIVVDD